MFCFLYTIENNKEIYNYIKLLIENIDKTKNISQICAFVPFHGGTFFYF